jgi:hypothetical protein
MTDDSNRPGGPGGSTVPKVDTALAIAEDAAPEAIRLVLGIMRAPRRGAGIQLAAARLVLDIAGVGAAAADRRHAELLTVLRGKLSEEAKSEVLRALAECTGQREDADPDVGDDGDRQLQ